MHAYTIEAHNALTREARDLVVAWQGTDHMHSAEDVRRALIACDPRAPVRALLPYLVDACRRAGLLEVAS